MLRTRTILAALVAIALTGNVWGQSQQPSPSPGITSQPPQTQQEPAAKHQEELNKAATDQKIADFTELLFYATAALAGIAVFQLIVFGWQGIQLGRTIKHLAISERAHVSGGANRGRRNDDGSEVLVVTINNYGKTPAFIGTVAATICKKEELTNFPGWTVKDWKGYVFGPRPQSPNRRRVPV